MTTRINESKTLTKLISYECTWKFDGKKFISNQKWNDVNVGVSAKIQKNKIHAKKIIFGIPLNVVVKMPNS